METHHHLQIYNICLQRTLNQRQLILRTAKVDLPVCLLYSKQLVLKVLEITSDLGFAWKTSCFFCSKTIQQKNLHRDEVRRVETTEIRKQLIDQAHIRNDDWGWDFFGRLKSCFCLFAEEAVYHRSCRNKFYYFSNRKDKKRKEDLCIAQNQQLSKEYACGWKV